MGPATLILIAANVAVFALQSVMGETLVLNFALWPLGEYPIRGTQISVGFHVWQLFTSAFLHSTTNTSHLIFNMLGLWMFGRDVERVLGTQGFLALYAAAVLAGSLAQLAVVSMSTGPVYPTVGASGGVFGILLAFGMFFPRRTVVPLFPPIPMPAWVFVSLYALAELMFGVLGTVQGVAHFAHLGGMLGALLVIYFGRARINRLR
jgi:membrane associated rhomboid family serine protease